MTQQQTPNWRGQPEHCFWSEFKSGLGPADIVAKFKGSGDGFKPAVYGPFEDSQYIYSAMQKTGKSGNPYFDIQRVPKASMTEEQRAHQITNQEMAAKRSADIDKAHQENIRAWDEQAKSMLVLAANIAKQTEILTSVGEVLQKLANNVEIFVKGVEFKKANKLEDSA